MISQMEVAAEPGSFNQQADKFDNHLLKNYNRYPVEFLRGQGAYLFDSEGKKYLDFLSGIAVTGFGHNHAYIKSAVEVQLNNLWHTSNLFGSTGQLKLAEKLSEISGLPYVFFCNSGTEANEAAIKFARKWGGNRSHIITALGGFHGRTMGSLSASGQYKVWEGFFPLTPGFMYVPYGDISAIESSFNKNVVAVMLEPIQGESGVIIPPLNYLKQVRDYCDENNLLLILDEVQTGLGRTGKHFAFQHETIQPDIITVAKGIANGLPLGATICSESISNSIAPGCHGSTFGGNPVSVSAANAVIEILDNKILEHILISGKNISQQINSLNSPKVKIVRGKGLMIGVEFIEGVDAKIIVAKLLEKGVIAGTSGNSVMRLLPPYIIGDKEIEIFMNTLVDVLEMI